MRFIIFINLMFFIPSLALAEIIKIYPNTIITENKTFENVTLDLSQGYFIIENKATLTLSNCKIEGTISPDNPFLFNIQDGYLHLNKNFFNIKSKNILPLPEEQPFFYMIRLNQGSADIKNNQFIAENSYTVGWFVTEHNLTHDIKITHNHVKDFHGGVFLTNSKGTYIGYNQFDNISISSIVALSGQHLLLDHNIILFAGNNNVGDGIDIINSSDVTIQHHYIIAGSCYSIVILKSKNIVLQNNYITSGITYAIFIANQIEFSESFLLPFILSFPLYPIVNNENITIDSNYLAQNRFGLAVMNVSNLTVKNNIFIQKFSSDEERKFWTNNDNIFKNNQNILWENNLYKEAYAQTTGDENFYSDQFVPYPLHGGVGLKRDNGKMQQQSIKIVKD